MTKNLTPGPSPGRNYDLLLIFNELKRFAATMQQCSEAEVTKIHEFLNQVVPKQPHNRTMSRKRIEVETHLMPLEMALMLGNSDVIKQCQKSLHSAIEQLQATCISVGNSFDSHVSDSSKAIAGSIANHPSTKLG